MKKSYILLIVVALLFIIVILSFLFIQTPKYDFAADTSNSLKDCDKAEYIFKPDAVAKVVINKDNNTILVDVRDKHEFVNGHIANAVHIPKASILDDKNYEFFTDLKSNNQKVIFYGENVVDANIPFMILKQMGVENIGISCEGYDYFKNNDLKQIASTKSLNSNNETAVINFAKFIVDENLKVQKRIELEKQKKKDAIKKPVHIVKKTVITKPKPTAPIEEEEEEGC